MQSLVMTAGFGMTGLSAFVLVAVGSHVLAEEAYSSLALAWTVATIYGTVVGITAEQTVTRRVAAGAGPGLVKAVMRRMGWASMAALVLVVVGLSPAADRVADATVWAGAVCLVAVSWIVLSPVRGLLAGSHRFLGYAATLAVEALVRILLCVLAALVPAAELAALAGALFLPLVVSAVFGLFVLGGTLSEGGLGEPGSSGREQRSMASVAMLQQLCLSTAPLWLHWQSTDAGASGAFVSVTTYMRIPLVLATGLVTIVLAGASRSHASDNRSAMLRWIGSGLVTAAVFVGGAVLVLIALADVAIPILFGRDLVESQALLWLLGLSTVGAVASTMMTQIVYGAGRAQAAMLAWVIPTVFTTVGLARADGSATAMAATIALGQVLATATLLAVLPNSLPGSGRSRSRTS